MIREVTREIYRRYFPADPHPFLRDDFLALVEQKTSRIVRLMRVEDHSLGLIAGIDNGMLRSPFSAPFGGFHCSHQYLFYHLLEEYLLQLQEWLVREGLRGMTVTLPPDIYQRALHAKMVIAFLRLGFRMSPPDITHWAEVTSFSGRWAKSVVAQNCRKAEKHRLRWLPVTGRHEREQIYEVILRNRRELGRTIHMSLDDLLEVEQIIPVDFFAVQESNGRCIGGAIFYRGHPEIVQGIFMGDEMENRNLGTMDLMYEKIYDHYKKSGYRFIDLGTSSSYGEPNEGLIRFKELHNCYASLRYNFSWEVYECEPVK